ncbi:MAG: 16S rRNA (guanine(527)-N(7))-methyltransferase RsmG [Thermodesulfobacteriota bacterium]
MAAGKSGPEECLALMSQGAAELGLALKPERLAGLCRYYQELDRWRHKINLVATGSRRDLVARHFLDSLTLLPHLPPGSISLLDVGCGAGFPGLALKVARPEISLTLVEPRGKRVTFLRHVVRTLGLTGVTIVGERLTGPGQHGLGHFDLITSRAFTDLAGFLPLVEDYLAPSGRIIAMKGPKADEELRAWQQGQPDTSLALRERVTYEIPFLVRSHQLLIFS